MRLHRRNFVQGSLVAAAFGPVLAGTRTDVSWATPPRVPAGTPKSVVDPIDERVKLTPLSARLHSSRWAEQVEEARDAYFAVPNDDLLYSYRTAAGMPAPGKPMTGWAAGSSAIVFGQIVSGLSRLANHRDDAELRQKAIDLYEGWKETLDPSGKTGSGTYTIDKFLCAMVDLQLYAGHETLPFAKKILADAVERINPARPTANAIDWDGRNPGGQNEWYTLSENSYRAYLADPDPQLLDCARHWHYPAVWDRFEETANPSNPPVAHAYSHVNSFNGPAMAYAVTGERRMLDIAVNAFDWINQTQTFATGGYGPIEHLVYPGKGRLASSLEHSWNHAEIGCGSWAGFKLSTYLTQLTGEGRFLDWAERLLYNAVGAGLRADSEGHATYYADYRITGGQKEYYGDTWPCCAGTYIQDMAAYHELLYYQDTDDNLYLGLYLASEAKASVHGHQVKLTVDTDYPESETVKITVGGHPAGRFRVNLRVPQWCTDPSVTVNGAAVGGKPTKARWLAIDRHWQSGDVIVLTLPMATRLEAIDPSHPQRTALVHGPVVLAQDGPGSGRWLEFGRPAELTSRLIPTDEPLTFEVLDLVPEDNGMPWFRPFYSYQKSQPYRIYFDSDAEYAFQPAVEAGGARFALENAGTGDLLGIVDSSQRSGALAEATAEASRQDQYWRLVDRQRGGRVGLHNNGTDRFLGLRHRINRPGGPLAVWEPERAEESDAAWRVTAAGPGTVYLLNDFNNKVLAQDDDHRVSLRPRSDRPQTQWRLKPYGSIILVNRHSLRAVDVAGVSKEPGGTLQQWFKAYNDNQRWEFVPQDDGWFEMINIITKLRITAVMSAGGSPIQQQKQTDNDDQLWRLTPIDGSWFAITNKKYDKNLTVQGKGRANGDLLTLAGGVDTKDRHWRLD